MTDDTLIPSCLRSAEEYRNLPSEEKRSLGLRLIALRELGEELRSRARFEESQDIADFLEDLELDLSIRLDLHTSRQGGISVWQIHYSWTFPTSPTKMREALSNEVLSVIDSPALVSDAEIEEVVSWFEQAGNYLVNFIDHFQNAKSIHKALAFHLAIDTLVAKLLLSCHKLRFNPSILR